MTMIEPARLAEWFGEIDIYLFDQLLKGRFLPPMKLLDAGCGNSRNIVYFLRSGFNVAAVDNNPAAVAHARALAASLAPDLPNENFRVEKIESLSFDDESFDLVISSAVLHFADNETIFDQMLSEMWRVLKRGGILFARLASSISIEDRVRHLSGRRYHLPDGSDRFLVDEAMLLELTARLQAKLLEPIKTVNVQNMRAMTTWCLLKQ